MSPFPTDFGAGLAPTGALAWLVLGGGLTALVAFLCRERARRSAAEQELRESASRYRVIFETAVDAIIVADQHGVIQEFSKAAERMTGYSTAEVTGRNMRALLPASLRQENERYTARYL